MQATVDAGAGAAPRAAATRNREAAIEGFTEAIDPVLTFVKENIYEGPGATVGKPNLYSDYTKWVLRNGRKPIAARRFNMQLQQHIPGIQFKTVRGTDQWIGIGSLFFEQSQGGETES